MKKATVIISTFIFLSNTIFVSAWAHPCLMDNNLSIIENTIEKSIDVIPCHEEQQQINFSHCDGVCLCAHISTTSSFLPHDLVSVYLPTLKSIHIVNHDSVMVSHLSSSLYRPPKFIS